MAVFAPSTGARRTSAKPFARNTLAAIAEALPPAAGVSVKFASDTTATESCDVKAGMPVCRIELHAPSNSAQAANAADQPAIRDHPFVLLIEPLLSYIVVLCRIRSFCLRYLRHIRVAANPAARPQPGSIKPVVAGADHRHRCAEPRHALVLEIQRKVIAAEHRTCESQADVRSPALHRIVQDADIEERPPCMRVLIEQVVAKAKVQAV